MASQQQLDAAEAAAKAARLSHVEEAAAAQAARGEAEGLQAKLLEQRELAAKVIFWWFLPSLPPLSRAASQALRRTACLSGAEGLQYCLALPHAQAQAELSEARQAAAASKAAAAGAQAALRQAQERHIAAMSRWVCGDAAVAFWGLVAGHVLSAVSQLPSCASYPSLALRWAQGPCRGGGGAAQRQAGQPPVHAPAARVASRGGCGRPTAGGAGPAQGGRGVQHRRCASRSCPKQKVPLKGCNGGGARAQSALAFLAPPCLFRPSPLALQGRQGKRSAPWPPSCTNWWCAPSRPKQSHRSWQPSCRPARSGAGGHEILLRRTALLLACLRVGAMSRCWICQTCTRFQLVITCHGCLGSRGQPSTAAWC